MKSLEDKYIDLLLQRCLDLKNTNNLVIEYDLIHERIAKKALKRAYELGIKEVILDENNDYKKASILRTSTIEEIKRNPYFVQTMWNEQAKKNAAFLFIQTENPDAYIGIEDEKIGLMAYIKRNSRPAYNEKSQSGEVSWCITSLASPKWANQIFPNDENAYDKLQDLIYKMCMVDKENPIAAWDEYLESSYKKANALNKLNIKTLSYKNSLGTDLEITLPDLYHYACAYKEDIHNVPIIVNMPSYEIYTSPDYRKTEGIVYSSKPLIYNNKLVSDFFLEFSKGKVVNYNAKEGLEILKQIIESTEQTHYLGEAALVDYDSPISNTKLVYNTTLFDENASCHFALGRGFIPHLESYRNMTKEQIKNCGINDGVMHVDFMFGTSDLEIEATTKNNKKIKVFKKGNFNRDLI